MVVWKKTLWKVTVAELSYKIDIRKIEKISIQSPTRRKFLIQKLTRCESFDSKTWHVVYFLFQNLTRVKNFNSKSDML